jgi:hypothetical protein
LKESKNGKRQKGFYPICAGFSRLIARFHFDTKQLTVAVESWMFTLMKIVG